MNEKVKSDWLAALRNGQHGQAPATLVHHGKYGAMGVLLLTLCGQEFHGGILTLGPKKMRFYLGGVSVSWWDADIIFGELGLFEHQIVHIKDMNDGDRASFKWIADWIQDNA